MNIKPMKSDHHLQLKGLKHLKDQKVIVNACRQRSHFFLISQWGNRVVACKVSKKKQASRISDSS